MDSQQSNLKFRVRKWAACLFILRGQRRYALIELSRLNLGIRSFADAATPPGGISEALGEAREFDDAGAPSPPLDFIGGAILCVQNGVPTVKGLPIAVELACGGTFDVGFLRP